MRAAVDYRWDLLLLDCPKRPPAEPESRRRSCCLCPSSVSVRSIIVRVSRINLFRLQSVIHVPAVEHTWDTHKFGEHKPWIASGAAICGCGRMRSGIHGDRRRQNIAPAQQDRLHLTPRLRDDNLHRGRQPRIVDTLGIFRAYVYRQTPYNLGCIRISSC